MVKHIILWKLKEEFSEEEKKQIKAGIKEGLEGLAGQIPGMTEIKVRIDCLPSSTVDVTAAAHELIGAMMHTGAAVASMI